MQLSVIPSGTTQTASLIVLSPCGRFIGSASSTKVMVWSTNKLSGEPLHIFSCVDRVEKIEFSPDSEFIMAALFARSAVLVFSLKDSNWNCRINENAAGILSVQWAPDARRILVESEFGIYLSLWSLVDNTQRVISHPKPIIRGGLWNSYSFSDNGRLLTVLHRQDLQDSVAVYSLNPVTELHRFKTRSNDVCVVQFISNDTHILTIDSALAYKACIYSPSGELLKQYEPYTKALGIRSYCVFNNQSSAYMTTEHGQPTLKYTPQLQSRDETCAFLALGSFNSEISIMALFAWQVVFNLPLVHPRELPPGMNPNNVVTKVEINNCTSQASGKDQVNDVVPTINDLLDTKPTSSVLYVTKMLKSLPRLTVTNRSSDNLPPQGVNMLQISPSGLYVAASDAGMPRCLWIFNPSTGTLIDLLVQQVQLTSIAWQPGRFGEDSVLAFSTGTSTVYLWSLATGVHRFEGLCSFNVQTVTWTTEGDKLLLKGRESFTIVSPSRI